MSDSIELSSPYGSGLYGMGGRPHTRPSVRSLASLHRKSASAQYNPILTPQEELSGGFFQRRVDNSPPPSTTTLPPGRVGKFGTDLLVEILVCSFAVLVSVPFMWLAVTAAKFDGHRVTEADTDYIKQTTSTASTLFTILFAAVLGSTLKRFATWRLENGVRLGLLEQIMQSRTFFAAVTTQLSFPAFNLTALILLSSWVFSPLGSQASLRLVSTGRDYTADSGTVSYVDTITNQVFDSVSGVDSLLTSLKPSYVSSVLGPTTMKNGTMDLWGNVRIPWLLDNLDKNADGWSILSKANMTEGSFSALVGVPMASLANRNSSFVIETTYMNLDCDKPRDQDEISINFNVTSGNGTFLGPNTTVSSDAIYPFWQVAMNQFVSDDYYFYGYPEQLVNVIGANIPQATFLFQTRGPWVAKCQINQIYLESNVSCQSVPDSELPVCSVTAQRNSPNKHAPSTVTTLSFPSTFSYLAQTWILATDPLPSSGYSSLSEYYLQNTTAAFILSGNGRNYADYSNVTAQQFSQRLGQLLNTWVLLSQVSADTMQFPLNHRNTTAFYTEGYDVYVVSWVWLGVYCASIGVMLVAAFCSIWCAYNTTIPDVLSFCSSLTRDSTYFDFAKGGSALDGIVRARMLRNVEVKLGEVVDRRADDGFATDFVNDINVRRGSPMAHLAVAPPEYLRKPRRGLLYA
ncbi:uncharacterized protein Z519_08381 [Cladophialophora bantiana CBS 173.52]|uniref:Uncharacterized protein n=1 Tax=Cladophialophora bantiana (strain ATCC 10958 / CBS 173.52 / CDC B-1940 / NIH 8579) TaxID=1442370 RepID=A0A0D2HBI3_CLAB1|nr:uncharacterized protein Z519_08381 [Cladophialophora bantiana CBS 173.52]KIW90598.1 hypothetical protein Z519_08381 [Cladophialophora bantiana CBS 173.52]